MKKHTTRRQLLAHTGRLAAAGAAGTFMGRSAWAQDGLGANDRIGLSLIGCGRRGSALLDALLTQSDVGFPVICDVDAQRAAQAAAKIEQTDRPRPEVVTDFRRAIERRDVHGVVIATPDHWHAIPLVVACVAGKDAYVESPIAHDVMEGQAMIFATRKHHRVVQVGLQQRAGADFAEAVQQVQSGALGRIAQTRTWTFVKAKPIPPQPDGEPPSHLDYDRWLGPAPVRTYNAGRVIDNFDQWWDYSGGMLTRWNPHLQDVVHWAMKVNAPHSVVAVGGNFGLSDFRETPDTLEVVFEYEAEHRPMAGRFTHVYSLRLNNDHAAWGPAGLEPNTTSRDGTPMHCGTQFHGSQATLSVDRRRLAVLAEGHKAPDVQGETAAKPVPGLLTLTHLADFLTCMRTRNEPRAPIEAGHFALLPCHLANVAYRVGRKIYFDAQTGQCFSDRDHQSPEPAANAMLRRHYREPYVLPPI